MGTIEYSLRNQRMIVPPYNTPSFYTAAFNKEAAAELLRIVSPGYANDVAQVLVTSLDLASDIEAVHECQSSITHIAGLIGCEMKAAFNPIYLPTTADLSEKIEYDADGDVVKIDGFGNPYTSATFSCASEEAKLIEASVSYKQFEMPSIFELLRRQPALLS